MLPENERDGIVQYVLDQLARHNLDLTEKNRQILINKAIGSHETDGLRIMREQIEWEITLMAETRNPDKDRVMTISYGSRCPNQKQLSVYLGNIAGTLQSDRQGFYAVYPRHCSASDVSRKVKLIIKQGYF